MDQNKLELYKFLIKDNTFNKYYLSKMLFFSISDIKYIENLEKMENRNKKIDFLLDD